MNYLKYSLIIISILIINILNAGTTGKISGAVTDVNNNEPLVGCNVIIESTGMGSSTNINGEYFMLIHNYAFLYCNPV